MSCFVEVVRGLSPSPKKEREFSVTHSKSEAAIESAVFARSFPGIGDGVAGIERFDCVSDFTLTQRHQRRIPDQVWHATAKIIGHCLDVNRRLGRTYFVSLSFVLETNRSAAH